MGVSAAILERPNTVAQEPSVESTIEVMPNFYEYTHADGTVHHAENVEVARAACPVLGKMAVEKAELLLEVAAIGQQKMKEEQQKPKPEERPEAKKYIETEHEKQKIKTEPGLKSRHEPITQNEKTIETAQITTRQLTKQNIPQQLIELSVKENSKIETSKISIKPSLDTEIVDVLESYRHFEVTTQSQTEVIHIVKSKTARVIPIEQAAISDSEQWFEAKSNPSIVDEHETAPITAHITESAIPAVEILVTDAETVSAANEEAELIVEETDFEYLAEDVALKETEIQLQANEDDIGVADITARLKVEDDADELLEMLYATETVETYHKLIAITVDTEPIQATVGGAITTEEDISMLEVAGEADVEDKATEFYIKDIHDFETFIDEQPVTEEPITLEVIQEQIANEQPLEQTFVQLAQHLKNNLHEAQDTAKPSDEDTPALSELEVELNAILQEIVEILPTVYSINKETQEKRINITPEMTQKLLMLLRSIGYQNPRDALIEFVQLRGLTFLFQAIQCMCQLNHEKNRKEFLTKVLTLTSDNNNSRVRLSMLLASLAINRPQLAEI